MLEIDYIGCYQDHENGRIFRKQLPDNYQQTPATCLFACEQEGYGIAGKHVINSASIGGGLPYNESIDVIT